MPRMPYFMSSPFFFFVFFVVVVVVVLFAFFWIFGLCLSLTFLGNHISSNEDKDQAQVEDFQVPKMFDFFFIY